MHLTGSQGMHLTDHKGMHLTGSQMYAFNRITTCMHLTGSHIVYAFNRITHVCI